MSDNIIRISIIGPECSGKTSLAASLAAHYSAVMVPEFARKFLDQKQTAACYEDLLEIAEGQHAAEAAAAERLLSDQEPRLLIADTDLQVIRIWSEIAFQQCDNRILSRLAADSRDLYLLTYPDLDWEADGQREYPAVSDRLRIYHHYLDTLIQQLTAFHIIRGKGEERVLAARHAIDALISARLPHQDLP